MKKKISTYYVLIALIAIMFFGSCSSSLISTTFYNRNMYVKAKKHHQSEIVLTNNSISSRKNCISSIPVKSRNHLLIVSASNNPISTNNLILTLKATQKSEVLNHHYKTTSIKANSKIFKTTVERVQPKKLDSKKEDSTNSTNSAGDKSKLVALLLCFFLGVLGIHRFYLGYTGIGVIQLLTAGGFGIWFIIDFFRILLGGLKPKNGDYK